MDLTKKCKIASCLCLILSLALFASIIPFDDAPGGHVLRFDSKSEKEVNDEKDFQKQTVKYNKNYKDAKEYAKKKKIFVKNKDFLELINAERKKN
jgi:hypothetical protein